MRTTIKLTIGDEKPIPPPYGKKGEAEGSVRGGSETHIWVGGDSVSEVSVLTFGGR